MVVVGCWHAARLGVNEGAMTLNPYFNKFIHIHFYVQNRIAFTPVIKYFAVIHI